LFLTQGHGSNVPYFSSIEGGEGESKLSELQAHGHDVKVKKVDRLSSTRVRLTVELPGETVQSHEEATTRRYSLAARIPGFRPGKAPLKLIKNRYKDEIRKEVLSHLLQSGLAEALEETKLMPVNQPRVQFKEVEFGDGKPIQFEVEFEVQPEIELRNYKDIPVKVVDEPVTDADVDKTLTNLRERMAALEPLESTRPEKGNFAVVEIGFEIKKDPPRKEEPKNYTVEIGAGQLLVELDAAIEQMSVGEKKTVNAKFPEDYHDKDLVGCEAVYDCKLVELKKKVLPELGDAFAGQLKEGMTLETLKTDIRQNLEASKKDETDRNRRKEIIGYLIANNPFEVPGSLVENQLHRLVQWMEEDFKNRGVGPMQLKQEDVISLKHQAEEMVRGGLLLKEIAIKENITLDFNALETRVQAMAGQLNRSVEETRKWLVGKGMMERVQDEVITDQVYAFLIAHARHVNSGAA
jgi:trigger factor